jgi:hypothetical protein
MNRSYSALGPPLHVSDTLILCKLKLLLGFLNRIAKQVGVITPAQFNE